MGKVRIYDQSSELQIIDSTGRTEEYSKENLTIDTRGDKLIIVDSTQGEVLNEYFYNFLVPSVNSLRELVDILDGYIETSVLPSAVQIKNLYESNPDTNAFTDSDKEKLDDTNRMSMVAGENIVVYQPLVVIGNEFFLFDEQNPLHENKYVGISITNTNTGAIATAATGGEIETTMTLIVGSIYYAIDPGALTVTKPDLGIVQIAGIATSETRFFITTGQTSSSGDSGGVSPLLLMGG